MCRGQSYVEIRLELASVLPADLHSAHVPLDLLELASTPRCSPEARIRVVPLAVRPELASAPARRTILLGLASAPRLPAHAQEREDIAAERRLDRRSTGNYRGPRIRVMNGEEQERR